MWNNCALEFSPDYGFQIPILFNNPKTMMQFSLDQGLSVTSHVLAQDLAGESVLLNIQTEEYFGLDDVGTYMWKILIEKESIKMAIATLQTAYDVEPTQLQHDVETLIDELLTHGLVELSAA